MTTNQTIDGVPRELSVPITLTKQQERDGAVWVSIMGDHRDYNEPINRDYVIWSACLDILKRLNPSFFMVSRLEAA